MIMNQAIQIIVLPVLLGILLFLLPSALRMVKAVIALGATLFTGYLAISLFGAEELVFTADYWPEVEKYCSFSLDNLSKLILLFMCLLSIVISIYSLIYKAAGSMSHLDFLMVPYWPTTCFFSLYAGEFWGFRSTC
jgi:formate hydrogenlyase subunit 3/multisubunit Na+/H+ antiporter MnhD subunit